ncbi:MAG: hypothetical protein AB7O67_06555 [Vicinamibacterales bacterium]
MTRYLIPLTLLLAIVAGCAAPAEPEGGPEMALLTPYLQVQVALAGDTLEGVPAAANQVADEADRIGAGGEAIAAGAHAVANAADLEAARTAFGELSDAVLAYTTAEGIEPQNLRVAYCPMVNKSWYQRGDAIRNPFYGSAMLECGAFKK